MIMRNAGTAAHSTLVLLEAVVFWSMENMPSLTLCSKLVRAVWFSMHTIATSMHIRWVLMLNRPRKPSTAIMNRLENQNRGAVKRKIKRSDSLILHNKDTCILLLVEIKVT